MDERIKSFREFYPFYLSEHTNPVSRKLHFIGTAFVFVILAIVIATGQGWYAAAIPIVGYGFAWAGHFFFEKNKPATFRYPIWSLASDFKLFFEILTGRRSFNP
jgi:hypothetical protein